MYIVTNGDSSVVDDTVAVIIVDGIAVDVVVAVVAKYIVTTNSSVP